MGISKEHIDTMYKQIELDCNLKESHKIKDDMVIAPTRVLPGSRVIDKLDSFFRVIVFMGKAYIMADKDTIPGWEEILKNYPAEWFFNYSRLRKIDRILNEYDREIVDTHIYFLPDKDAVKVREPENLRWFTKEDIEASRDINPFHNAWPYSPTQPDVTGVGMPKGDDRDKVTDMAALAGASLDGKYVHQIGIDVLPQYRGQGLAPMLVSILKQRILEDGSLPFYGTAESHAISRMTAIRSGFLPAFAELFVGKKDLYDPDKQN